MRLLVNGLRASLSLCVFLLCFFFIARPLQNNHLSAIGQKTTDPETKATHSVIHVVHLSLDDVSLFVCSRRKIRETLAARKKTIIAVIRLSCGTSILELFALCTPIFSNGPVVYDKF